MTSVNIIGAGRCGMSLAMVAIHRADVTIQAIANQTLSSAQHAVAVLDSGYALATLRQLPAADYLWITTPDDVIAQVVSELVACERDLSACTVLHCSGVLPAAILAPLKSLGAQIASVHPARSFVDPQQTLRQFHGTLCVVEGELTACQHANELFTRMGAQTLQLTALTKQQYHAACCVAANTLVGLAGVSEHIFREAGIESATAKALVNQLMRSSVDNMQHAPDLHTVLTGPLARGDVATLQQHYEALADLDLTQLYMTLTEMTQKFVLDQE